MHLMQHNLLSYSQSFLSFSECKSYNRMVSNLPTEGSLVAVPNSQLDAKKCIDCHTEEAISSSSHIPRGSILTLHLSMCGINGSFEENISFQFVSATTSISTLAASFANLTICTQVLTGNGSLTHSPQIRSTVLKNDS